MSPKIDKARRRLSREERERIFNEMILPSILTGKLPAKDKTFVAVCSQPGGGKSTMVRELKKRFDEERAISISVDDFYNYLPGLNEARMKGASWGSHLLHEKATVKKWTDDSLKYALKNKTHLIVESCVDPQSHAKFYLGAGYKNRELYIIATDRHTSLTSIFSRAVRGFNSGTMANCAVLSKESHDRLYCEWPKIAFQVEETGSFEKISIATRDLGVCYQNEVIARTPNELRWSGKCEAAKQIIELNNRHFTQSRIDQLNATWDEVFASPLKNGEEFGRYPLWKYRDDIMSHAESLGGRYDPDIVLPEDRTADRESYLKLLREHLELIEKNLDSDDRGDRALEVQTLEIYQALHSRTERNLNAGIEMRRNADELVARDKAREGAMGQGSRALSSHLPLGGRGYGSFHLSPLKSANGAQVAPKAHPAAKELLPVKRLRSPDGYDGGSGRLQHDVTSKHSEREQDAAKAFALGEDRPAKRARYEDRPRDGGRV